MLKSTSAAIAASALVVLSPPALAGGPVPVLWDEAIDGDLADLFNAGTNGNPSDFGNWTDVGTLPFGDAVVTGEASERAENFGFIIDGDALAFTVPAGEQLVGLSMDHNQSLGVREFFALDAGGTSIGDVYVSRGFPINFVSSTGLNTPATTDLLALAGGPLGEGTYVLSFENALRFNNETIMEYTLTFTTTPTPGGWMAFGVAATALSRRRRA